MSNLIFAIYSSIIVTMGVLVLIRNHKVYKFRIKLLEEESEFCKKRIYEGKGFPGFLRYDTLPGYVKMLLQFWYPWTDTSKTLLETTTT